MRLRSEGIKLLCSRGLTSSCVELPSSLSMDNHGKIMRMELTNGAEAVGTFISAHAPSQQIAFTKGMGDHSSCAFVCLNQVFLVLLVSLFYCVM